MQQSEQRCAELSAELSAEKVRTSQSEAAKASLESLLAEAQNNLRQFQEAVERCALHIRVCKLSRLMIAIRQRQADSSGLEQQLTSLQR